MGLQMVKWGYRRLQGITRGDKGLQEVTSYKALHDVTGGDKRLPGVTEGDKGLQRITRGYRG